MTSRYLSSLRGLALTALLWLQLTASFAMGQYQIFRLEESGASDFGASVGTLGDIDLDGASDIYTTDGFTGNYLTLISGRVGNLICQIRPVNLENWYLYMGRVSRLTVVGDVNSDGYPDVAIVGTKANENAKLLYYSGRDCRPLFSVSLDRPVEYAIPVSLGDLNADGYQDILINGSCFSGRDGVPLWTLSPVVSRLNYAAIKSADLNGDGVADILAQQSQDQSLFVSGGVLAFSAADGRLLWSFDGVAGNSFDAIKDINGDNVQDVAALSLDEHSIELHSGTDGRLISVIHGSHNTISRMAYAGDPDRDGYPDFVLSLNGTGKTVVMSGKDGRALYTLNQYGATTANIDCNGDGYEDVVLGRMWGLYSMATVTAFSYTCLDSPNKPLPGVC